MKLCEIDKDGEMTNSYIYADGHKAREIGLPPDAVTHRVVLEISKSQLL